MKPEHSAILLVVFVFIFAGLALFVEQRDERDERRQEDRFALCPLCNQEVRP
jgi:hypothetical protein